MKVTYILDANNSSEVSKLVGLKPDKVRRIIINSQKQLRHLMKEWEDFECEAT